MTTLRPMETTCALCGAKSEQTVIGSTNSFGAPDLDLRPPEMKRSTLRFWVQECPSCGYAFKSIEKTAVEAESTVAGDAYQAVASGPLQGSVSGRCLKASILAEEAPDLNIAANYALWAAWAADDDGDKDGAVSHRSRAADLFDKSLNGEDESSEHAIITRTLMVDILRRAERWAEAMELANTLLKTDLDAAIRTVLKFQVSVASKKDDQCYTVDEAGVNGKPSRH
jgi:hypothetical protein